jgi:hypothetical protein
MYQEISNTRNKNGFGLKSSTLFHYGDYKYRVVINCGNIGSESTIVLEMWTANGFVDLQTFNPVADFGINARSMDELDHLEGEVIDVCSVVIRKFQGMERKEYV